MGRKSWYCKTDCEKISYYNIGSDEVTESTRNLAQSKFADETTSMKIKKLVQMQKYLKKNIDSKKKYTFKTHRVKLHSTWEKTKSIYKFRLIQNPFFIRCQKTRSFSYKSNKTRADAGARVAYR